MGYCAFQQHRLYICHRREGLLRLPFHHIHHVARLDALAGGDRVATYHIPSNHRPCNAATIRHKYRFGQRLRKDVALLTLHPLHPVRVNRQRQGRLGVCPVPGLIHRAAGRLHAGLDGDRPCTGVEHGHGYGDQLAAGRC